MSSQKCCCCCCLLLLLLFFIGVAVVFVLRDKLGPSLEANYKVTDALLSQFGVSSGSNLEYNLAANITVDNPSKYVDYKFEKFEVVASYNDQDLNEVNLSKFYVEKKNKNELTPLAFKGQRSVSFKDDIISKIKKSAAFDIVLKINVKMYASAGKIDIYNEYKVECNLKVPLINSKGKSAEKFESTDCKQVSGSRKSGIKL